MPKHDPAHHEERKKHVSISMVAAVRAQLCSLQEDVAVFVDGQRDAARPENIYIAAKVIESQVGYLQCSC